MFKGVLFDLDGVITDTAKYHYEAWKKIGKEINIEIDIEFNERLKGVSREDSLKRLLEFGNRQDDFTEEEFNDIDKRKNDYYFELIQNVSPKDIYPGIKELLEELKDNEIKISLASASKNAPFLLGKMELTNYFDAIADPNDIKNGKPAPDIFNLAAEKVGIKPNESIGIEDAQAGIEAIKRSGGLPVGVGKPEDLGFDIDIVDSTKKLNLNYLKSIWNKRM